MKYIEFKNNYDVIEMSREELEAIVLLMKYVSERTAEQMPEPVVFDDIADWKECYRCLLYALDQMNSNDPKVLPFPSKPNKEKRDWIEAVVIEVSKDNVTLASYMTADLSMTFGHFSEFYRFIEEENKKLIPSKDMINYLRMELGKMIDCYYQIEGNNYGTVS